MCQGLAKHPSVTPTLPTLVTPSTDIQVGDWQSRVSQHLSSKIFSVVLQWKGYYPWCPAQNFIWRYRFKLKMIKMAIKQADWRRHYLSEHPLVLSHSTQSLLSLPCLYWNSTTILKGFQQQKMNRSENINSALAQQGGVWTLSSLLGCQLYSWSVLHVPFHRILVIAVYSITMRVTQGPL